MSNKLFWFDTETTGVDCRQNSMVQLGAIIEIDGVIKEEIEFLFQPLPGRKIDPVALEINRRTEAELMEFPHPSIGITALKKKLSKYVNKFDKTDKFVQVGFNVMFDCDFLRQTWVAAGDRYGPGSYMFNCPWDVRTDVAKLICRSGLRLKNYKLGTICKHFGIKLEKEHDAIADVRATRELALFAEDQLRKAA